jgi:hypothetical protein
LLVVARMSLGLTGGLLGTPSPAITLGPARAFPVPRAKFPDPRVGPAPAAVSLQQRPMFVRRADSATDRPACFFEAAKGVRARSRGTED